MSRTLHAAIRHAVADSPAYRSRGILVSLLLEAEADLRVGDDVLYNAVYTLFCALPHRILPGTSMVVSTFDVQGGVELRWECREEPTLTEGDLRQVLRQGPHGDLVDIAFAALERFCGLRAGDCLTDLAPVPASPHFPRGVALHRRVRAFLPASREDGLASTERWRERAASASAETSPGAAQG